VTVPAPGDVYYLVDEPRSVETRWGGRRVIVVDGADREGRVTVLVSVWARRAEELRVYPADLVPAA